METSAFVKHLSCLDDDGLFYLKIMIPLFRVRRILSLLTHLVPFLIILTVLTS